MPFDDAEFFARLLRSGGFLIILDGLNEADLERPLREFAATTPSVRLLMTSQLSAFDRDLLDYELSPLTPEHAKNVLVAFLGKEVGEKAKEQIVPALWDDIRSGYDVQLLADLVRASHKLPKDRLGLYTMTMERAEKYYDDYPFGVVYRFARKLWKGGKRSFQPDSELTGDLLNPLDKTNVVIKRKNDFQLRHDLMRGFLAACWIVLESASPKEIINRLSDEEIWKLGVSDQDEAFTFVADLLNPSTSLAQVAQFAASNIDVRIRLLIAVQEAARRKGHSLSVAL